MALDNTLKRFSDAKQAIIDSLNNKGVITDTDIGFEDFSSKIDEIEGSIQEEEIITQDSGWNYIVLEDNTIQLTLYTGNDTEIVVPNRYIDNGICYKVSKVGNPNAVIAWNAQYGIYGPKTTYNVFSESSLTSTTIDDKTKSITSIEVAEGVSIEHLAFRYCENLTSVKLHKNIKNIGVAAFGNCTSLTGHLIIPEGVTYIDTNAFSSSAINEITLPKSLKGYSMYILGYIDNCSLTKLHFNCKHLDNFYVAPNNQYAWPFSIKLLTSIFDTEVQIIPHGIFAAYTNPDTNPAIERMSVKTIEKILVDLTSLETISSCAFTNNSAISNIFIPNSVKTIEYGAFVGCGNLTDVWYIGNEDDRQNINIDESNQKLIHATWHYVQPVEESNYTYIVINNEAIITNVDSEIEENVTIPSTLGDYPVTGINSYSFKDCINVTRITIPDTITHIGVKAFTGCSKLTNITIPDSVKALGYTHFENYA